MSAIERKYVDCSARSYDFTEVYKYAEPMGKGNVVESNHFPLTRMETPPPSSVGEGSIVRACELFAARSLPRKPVPSAPKRAPQPEVNPF